VGRDGRVKRRRGPRAASLPLWQTVAVRDVVPGLPADLEDVLWDVARERLPAGRLQPRALAAAVAEQSERYTTRREELDRAGAGALLAARLLFFGPSDAARLQVPLAELDSVTPLPRSLRVLDLGAGTGAMTLGLLSFLRRRGGGGEVEVEVIDVDAEALALVARVAERARGALAPLRLEVRTRTADLAGRHELPPGPFDLVLAGSLLNELHAADADRAERRAALVVEAASRLRPEGAVVVVEPALRLTARDLAALRPRLLAAGLVLFAPCPHAVACPLLVRERDWCHEARRVAASPRLQELVRATGLRQAEVRFSYLTLRRGGPSLAEARGAAWRVVSHPLPAKGMTALELCGDGRAVRVERLNRDETDANAAWDDVRRGDVVGIEPALGEGARVRLTRGHVVRKS
jgi:SAM-dependent methyltransferase